MTLRQTGSETPDVDMDGAVAGVGHGSTPHVLVDALATDDVTRADHEHMQDVELARRDVQACALDEDLPLGGRELNVPDDDA